MKITDIITEAANPAQQAAIAISMKKAGKKPNQGVAEGLDEAVGGNYLYHATSPAGLKGILQSGYIGAQQTAQAATNAQTKLPSVAVTRDWNYAAGSSRSSEGVGQGAVIVFDRNSIESKYKTFGTSQSSMIKGLPNTTADSPQMKKLAMQIKFKDANKNSKLDYNELPAGAGGAALKHNYFRPKAGAEAEEAVVVPKGNLPLQGSMIGFWVDPKSELASDPTIMNDPRRLDMPRPNQFVKAAQQQGVAEGAKEDMSKEVKAMATGTCPHCHGPVKKKEHPTLTQYHCVKCGIRASQDKQGVAESTELAEEFDLIESIVEMIAEHNGVDAEAVWADLESLTEDELYVFAVTSDPLMEDWQKANKRDKTDGMSQKAVNAYRRENPGSKLKTAVTTKPGKLKKGGKASKRRKSYCSRSRGQMKMHSISCAKTPDKAICKARRRWNC